MIEEYKDDVLFEVTCYNFCSREQVLTFQVPDSMHPLFSDCNVLKVSLVGNKDDREPDDPDYLLTISPLPRNLYELNDLLRCYSVLSYEEKVAFVDVIRETGNPYAYKRIIELIKDGVIKYTGLSSGDDREIFKYHWDAFFKDESTVDVFLGYLCTPELIRDVFDGKCGFFSVFREDWIQCPSTVLEELRRNGKGKNE